GLLDRARADPAHEVQLRTGLVVRARRARAAERLLTDDSARGLVVDVEVARGVAQRRRRLADRRTVAREDRARKRIRRGLVDDLARLCPLVVGIDVRRDHRSEDLFAEQLVAGIVGLDERRLDEVPLLALHAAAMDDLRGAAAVLDVLANLRERLLIDNGTHEVTEVADIAHLDVLHHRHGAVAHFVPQRLRNVYAA